MKVFCVLRSCNKPNCDMSVLLLPYQWNFPSLFLNSEIFSKKCIWCITDFVPLLMFPFPASHYIAGRAKVMAPITFFCGASFEMSTCMFTHKHCPFSQCFKGCTEGSEIPSAHCSLPTEHFKISI